MANFLARTLPWVLYSGELLVGPLGDTMNAAQGCHFWRESQGKDLVTAVGSPVLHKLPGAVAVCWGGDSALGCHWWLAQKV